MDDSAADPASETRTPESSELSSTQKVLASQSPRPVVERRLTRAERRQFRAEAFNSEKAKLEHSKAEKQKAEQLEVEQAAEMKAKEAAERRARSAKAAAERRSERAAAAAAKATARAKAEDAKSLRAKRAQDAAGAKPAKVVKPPKVAKPDRPVKPKAEKKNNDSAVPPPPAMAKAQSASWRSYVAAVIGGITLLFAVLLASGALIAALGMGAGDALYDTVAPWCDALVGPLKDIFRFSGSDAAAKQNMLGWGLGSLIYLIAGFVVQFWIRPKPED